MLTNATFLLQVDAYIQEVFGGGDKLEKDILIDFFRSAFDGSGADNFYDAVWSI